MSIAQDAARAQEISISPELRAQVEELKKVCAEDGLQLKSDFEAVRLVIVCEGKIKDCVKRVRNIRECEQRYKLEEIDSLQAFKTVHEAFPGCSMMLTGQDEQGRLIMYGNMSKFFPGKLKDPEFERIAMKYFHDLFHTSAVSMDEFEKGIVFVANCKAMGWKNFNLKMEKDFAWMYQEGFPIRMKSMIMFNSGTILRAVVKLCKLFLTKKMQERIVIVNHEKDLDQFVDVNALPAADGLGQVSEETFEQMFKERLAKFQQYEQTFTL